MSNDTKVRINKAQLWVLNNKKMAVCKIGDYF